MTTIINDVDVSGCSHLDEWKHCNICKELIKSIPNRHQCIVEQDLRCESYLNCYYKQLQRAKQDNINIKKAFNDILLEILEMKPYDGEIRADGNTPLVVIRNYKKEYRQYKQALNEIKAIAEADSPFIDNFEIKSATEVGYDYATICNELELRLHKVLELITKAEGE